MEGRKLGHTRPPVLPGLPQKPSRKKYVSCKCTHTCRHEPMALGKERIWDQGWRRGKKGANNVCSTSLFAPRYVSPWGFQLPPGHSTSTRLGNHIVRDLSETGLFCQGLGAAASLEVLARAQWVGLMLNQALSACPSCLIPPGVARPRTRGLREEVGH